MAEGTQCVSICQCLRCFSQEQPCSHSSSSRMVFARLGFESLFPQSVNKLRQHSMYCVESHVAACVSWTCRVLAVHHTLCLQRVLRVALCGTACLCVRASTSCVQASLAGASLACLLVCVFQIRGKLWCCGAFCACVLATLFPEQQKL